MIIIELIYNIYFKCKKLLRKLNVALYPLLLLIVAPLGKSPSADESLVRGRPPEIFDVPSVETSLLSIFRIMLDCD